MNDFIDRISQFSREKLTMLAAQLRDRVEALETRDKIAIVGVGCRFPGGIESPESYWEVLTARRDVISEVPADRWDVDALYDPDPEKPGKISSRYGGWLDDVDLFDPKFFSISPREAQSLDPQQRLLLEVTWRALENAGLPAARLAGTKTGVFCGISGVDYHGILRAAGTESYDAYMASGVAHSIASGRLSYFLGLHGPSLSIDTACSSSLVAIHEAVQSLRRRECDVALAGGSNLILTPETTIALSRAQMMAPDGRCKAFDARANGFVRSEGCGMVVLKRLSDAQSDGDPIVAVIRGSAVNQDGRSNGLTAPNGTAQEAVLQAALKDASVDAADIGFVETHGTGTALGDPIEVHALGAVLGNDRGAAADLRLGSVKSSIGHLEASAGVAGLIKAALSLHHSRLPGQANLETLNPLIQWDRLALEPQRQTEAWPTGLPRMAGVSSFGFSGTNVHVVLEPAPQKPSETPVAERGAHLLTVSARSAEALTDLRLRRAAEMAGATNFADMAYSANAGRDHFPHRFATVAKTGEDAYESLRAGTTTGATFSGISPQKPPRIAFVFTGQGAQYKGMSQRLYDANPVFRASIDRYDEMLRDVLPVSLIDLLHGTAAELNDTALAQPALLAVELALTDLWKSWGITPHVALGHSLGEFAAAVATGVMPAQQALRLVAERGRLMASVPGEGMMISVMADETTIRDRLADQPDTISLAAINGPKAVVLSGDRTALEQFRATLDRDGFHTTELQVSQAFHSPLMDPILDEFEAFAGQFDYQTPSIDMISNVTGQPVLPGDLTARYWRDHIRSAVRFQDGLHAAADAGCDIFLEIGPHPVLTTMAQLDDHVSDRTLLSSLCRGENDETQMLSSLAQLYVHGADVDWRAYDAPWARSILPLSGHPFRRDRYWVDATETGGSVVSEALAFPGQQVRQSISDHTLFEVTLDPSQLGWLHDHRIHGQLVLPSPLLMGWALGAGQTVLGTPKVELAQFTMHRPLYLDKDDPVILQISLAPSDTRALEFTISAECENKSWDTLCNGFVRAATEATDRIQPDAVRANCPDQMNGDDFYEPLAQLGLEFGPAFRGVDHAFRGSGCALGRIVRSKAIGPATLGLDCHPAVLDASLHLIAAALPMHELKHPFLLLSVGRIELLAPLPEEFWCHATVKDADNVAQQEAFTAQLDLFDDEGQLLMRFHHIDLKRVSQQDFAAVDLPPEVSGIIHEVVWAEDRPAPASKELAAAILPDLEKLARDNGLFDTYPQFSARFDQLCAVYIVNALRDLGLQFVVGNRLRSEDMLRDLGIQAAHHRLLNRMLGVLSEDGYLEAETGGWHVLSDPPFADANAMGQELLGAFPGCAPEISITMRCGHDLAAVLSGRVDPLTLLFPEGSLAQTERLYSDSAPAKVYNATIAEIVAQLSQADTQSGPLRILEIGAGTGSATAGILQALGQADYEYHFTDISPLFLNNAERRFQDYPGLRFSTLDIDKDPVEQGLPEHGFDIVIAGNVLHATSDIRQTLSRVSNLIAPGGRLILLEGTEPQRFGDLTVGMLNGWWAYSDTDLRDYALMPRHVWLATLQECGFDQTLALPGADATGTLQEQAIFLAQWPGDQPQDVRTLIVGAPDPARELGAHLQAKGDHLVCIPAKAEPIGQALEAEQFDRVIFLATQAEKLSENTTVEQLGEMQKALLNPALALTRSLAGQNRPPAELVFLTQGAQATDREETADPVQATLWGFAHTVAIEYPEMRCKRIDTDAVTTDAIAQEIERGDAETQVALRTDRRLVRRLRNCGSDLSPTGVQFPASETLLITGGLRGLGLVVAQWAVALGARNLALLGRSAPSSEGLDAIAEMQKSGARVAILTADIGVSDQVVSALNEISDMPPVTSVIHAAGALDDAALLSMTWEKFETALNAKTSGTWLLHKHLPDLSQFVMFSSGASLAGSAGQANHAAANAFEDAMAWYRQAQGLPALTLNWGLWGDVGAGAEIGVGEAARALRAIKPQTGLAALNAAMSASADKRRAQLAVLDADWSELAHGDHTNAIFFSAMAERPAGFKPDPSTPEQAHVPKLRDQLVQTPVNRRRAVVLDGMRAHVRTVLGLASADVIEAHEPLSQMGLDSLMAVQLRNMIGDATGLSLPATLIFEYPTIAALTDFVVQQLDPELQDPETEPAEDSSVQSDGVTDDMTEDELTRHLMQELDRLDQRHNQ